MIDYTVELGERSYPIHIGPGVLDKLPEVLQGLGCTRALIVTNVTVGALYLKRVQSRLADDASEISVHAAVLPDGECYKDLAHIEKILEGCVAAGLDRKSVIVALGGGVIGDMAGFAASMWMRGIRFVQVPTTLLSQVDSSVGGKTGVNLPAGKNLIGAFCQPKAVLIDPEVLKTLPAREVSCGVAEIIKYGFLGDAAFVAHLERDMEKLLALESDTVTEVVAHCCAMKAEIVRRDETERGERAKLNLGHTFGHAIEKLSGYGKWLHGEAVGAGLVMSAVLSRRLGYLAVEDETRVRRLVAAAGLPVSVPGLSAREAYHAMQGDKKSENGQIRFVLMRSIGESVVQSVPPEVLSATMTECGWI